MTGELDVQEVTRGLLEFVHKRVWPLEESNRALLSDPRRLYDTNSGRYSDDVRRLLLEVRMASAASGYYTLFTPKTLGGAGMNSVALYRIWESLHSKYGTDAFLPYATIAHWTSGPSFLCEQMSPSLKLDVIPELLSGATTGCFAMSEAEAGSDAWSMTTSAKKDGDGWLINGRKLWISNGPISDFAFVFAVTDESQRDRRSGGISCFYVPSDTPGYGVESVIKLFGHVGGNEASILLDDVRVPSEYLVGELHEGFDLAIKGVSNGRIYNAGRSVGLAKWALRMATGYSTIRETFGKPLAEYQGVSFQLADSAIEIYAADAMALDCAKRIDAGDDADTHVAMVKVFASETAFRTFDRAIQVHGGIGLTNELALHAGWHESRLIRIADGSVEVMRRNIARDLIKRRYAV